MTVEIPALPDACWPVDWGCADADWLATLTPAVKDRSEAMATQVLRSLTSYQVGGCPITVRPCAKNCGPGGSYQEAPVGMGAHAAALGVQVGPWWASIDVDGQWINTSCGCTTECSCTAVPEVLLPSPVGGIVSVVLDGADATVAMAVAARIRSAVSELSDGAVSLSAGVALGTAVDEPDLLYRHADRAQYRAKDAGGDRVELAA
jgi:hypothetical protein